MSTAAPLQNTAAQSPLVSKASHTGLLLQRKCACGGPASSSLSGECGECSKKRLQKKLSIGASNDPLEQEADRVAEQVLAAPASSTVSSAAPHFQRFTGQAAGDAGAAPASVDRILAGSGRPLDAALQRDMGQRFGHDFSKVRVHSGAAAEQSAREVNAHAYTVGHNIVFGAGRFSPGTYEGKRLLAHELTHVVQQNLSASGQMPTSERSVQRQLITPLAAGGGFGGLMERDRRDSMAPGSSGGESVTASSTEPIVYMCSKALDTSPMGSHALFRIGGSGTGNPTISLQPVDTLLADCWQGVPDRNYPSDLNADAECEATAIGLSCLEREFSAYPIGHYCTLGPNSNTFVGHIAKSCGISDPDPPGWTPGIDDSPPPSGTFAPDKWETLTGCETKICLTPPGPPGPPIG